jgi:hypothetical protein
MNAKSIKSLCCIAGFIGAIILCSIAFAQQGGGGSGQPDLVGWMDKDKDGKISKAEWSGDPKAFAKYDKNGDGYILADEKPTGMPTIEVMDKNGDGKITKDEFPTDAAAGMFDQFDKDKNGSLSESEISSPPSGGGGGAPGGGGGSQGSAPPAGGTPAPKR